MYILSSWERFIFEILEAPTNDVCRNIFHVVLILIQFIYLAKLKLVELKLFEIEFYIDIFRRDSKKSNA